MSCSSIRRTKRIRSASTSSRLTRTSNGICLASDLVSVFRRLSTSFGDQMTTVLGNAILAFLESTEGGTLSDLRRFLVEPAFRERFLATVQDSEVVYYWQKEFPLLTGKPQGPILTRLDTFLRPKVIRHMVSQKENRLDFAAIMNGRKILLAKLSQGSSARRTPISWGRSSFPSSTRSRRAGRTWRPRLARRSTST